MAPTGSKPDPRLGQRNQHMAGVTTAYEFCSVVSQAQIEMASSSTPAGPVHVLDAYAMANSVLCSRRPGAGR